MAPIKSPANNADLNHRPQDVVSILPSRPGVGVGRVMSQVHPTHIDDQGPPDDIRRLDEELSGVKDHLPEIDLLQQRLHSLEGEVTLLRKRDEQLKCFMSQVDEEMRLAARLQRDFLPKQVPEVGRARFHTVFRPAGYVSGDLYDICRLDEHHVGVFMADAVGHGMPAALLTMFMKNALTTKEIMPAGYRLLPPSETIARLNAILVNQHLSSAHFATAVYGVLNTQTLEGTFARAGHPDPVLMRADGDMTELVGDGGLLGIFPDDDFAEVHFKLEPGDKLMVYTDGIEVALGGDGDTLDVYRWKTDVAERKHLPAGKFLDSLVELVDSKAGSLAPRDDLTIIMIEAQ